MGESTLTLLITGGKVVVPRGFTFLVLETDILVRDGRIAAVGKAETTATDVTEKIDARECLVVPGFIDSHRHTWQSALRHRLGDFGFAQYGAEMLARIAPHFTADDVYVGTFLGAISALDSGTTTLVDWSHIQNTPAHADAAIQALRDAGLRAVFAHGYPRDPNKNWTRGSREQHPRDIRRVRDVLSDDNALVTLAMAARGPEMTSMETAVADLRLARSLDIRVSMHVGASDLGPRFRAVDALAKCGVLGPDMTFVHLSSTERDELQMVADHGVHVSLGPWTESVTPGVGGCPLNALLGVGLTPSLSGDTEVSGSGDMFTQMRSALAAGRRAVSDPASVAPTVAVADVLRYATIAGAASIGRSADLGVIQVGARADLALIRLDDLNMAPSLDPIGSLVLAAHGGNVDTVLVDGRVRKRGGRLLGVDKRALGARAHASATRVLAAASRGHAS